MSKNGPKFCLIVAILSIVAGLLVSACVPAKPKTFTIGVVNTVASLNPLVEGFKSSMVKFGYVEGENVTYLYEGPVSRDQVETVVQGLVASRVNLILSVTTPAVLVTKEATAESDLPVVFAVVINPVGAGIVASAERPGGNMTGVESSL
ncbi:MAG: hypothetical protein JW934_07330, partial [Anaerolineae bacterium]|nr:hypothetical protein [Anaerolineae bacterium]